MKRVLIVRTDRIGDVIMVTPMIREIRKQYPDAYIGTLTQPYTSDIFLHNPHLDVALTDDLAKKTFWSVTKEIRSHSFTDGLLVWPTERAAYQMFFAGIRNRIGVGHKLYGFLTIMRGVSRHNYTPLRHEADYCMDLARKIGIRSSEIAPELFVTDDERAKAHAILGSKGISPGDTKLFVHTGTGGSSPNWSESKYISLLKALMVEFPGPGVKIVLTAREMGNPFLDEALAIGGGRIVTISNDIADLRGLITSIAVADLLITPSTGPEHIADALNIRCIGLHCHRPMNSARYWGILNRRSVNLEVTDEYCRRHCSADQNSCAIEGGIEIDEVIRHAKKLIGN